MVAVMRDTFGRTGHYKLRAGGVKKWNVFPVYSYSQDGTEYHLWLYFLTSLGLFMGLGLSGVVPGLHYLYVNGLWESWDYTQWLFLMAISYLIGGAIYAVRVPERLSPGTFDIYVSARTPAGLESSRHVYRTAHCNKRHTRLIRHDNHLIVQMQSHQILHVCVLGGVLFCYIGITRLAADRNSVQDFCALETATH